MRKLPPILAEIVAESASRAALFHEAIETVTVGIVMLDLEGKIRYANSAYCEMSGYPASKLLNRSFLSLEELGDEADARMRLLTLLGGAQEHLRLKSRHLRKGGSWLWVHINASLLRDGKGNPHAVIAVVEDMTPQHVSEDALHDVLTEQQQVMEAIPQMVWVTGPAGEPEFVNERWRAFTNTEQSSEPFGGLELIHAEDRERTAEAYVNALRTKSPYEIEHRMRHANGSYRWVLARAQPLIDATGRVAHWFGTSTDIHERKGTENLLRRTEKLAAAGRLAATVAHEINNPLEAVSNLIYLALHEDGLPVVSRHYLRMANEELRRVSHIVSQTLGFYRESSAPQAVDLSVLVNDVLSLYERKLDARQIRVTRNMESVMVEGVAGELRQVVANLLSNALDAMEPYGVLAMELRSQSDEVRLSISDTGHGIAAPLLEHIFEPFFTTKKDVGTGLGLWVSKGIVEKHQGRLEVASSQKDEDHGTAFVMTLPRRGEMLRSA
ncbi:MAG TPA: PAS domain S-box protein [Acidobacteriaceae bacterium]